MRCSTSPMGPPDGLAQRIAGGDPDAILELYGIVNRRVHCRLRGRLSEDDVGDVVHDTLAIVVEGIRKNEMRQPQALLAYTQTVLKRRIASGVMRSMWLRKRTVELEQALVTVAANANPEALMLARERNECLARALGCLRPRDKELLIRFYFEGESHGKICAEMRLSATQFRLYKSRAKAKLTAWVRAAR